MDVLLHEPNHLQVLVTHDATISRPTMPLNLQTRHLCNAPMRRWARPIVRSPFGGRSPFGAARHSAGGRGDGHRVETIGCEATEALFAAFSIEEAR